MSQIERQLHSATCCLCLSEDESTLNSNTVMKSVPLHEMVNFCIGIQINPDKESTRLYSTSICNECAMNISNFYTFKKKILEAQELITTLTDKNERNNDNTEEYLEDEMKDEELLETDNEVEEYVNTSSNYETIPFGQAKNEEIYRKRSNDITIPKTSSKKVKVDAIVPEKVTIQLNECLICPAVLGDILKLKDHIDAHSEIKCKACNRQFARYSNLKRHFNSVHSKPKPFQCDVCGLGFYFTFNLQTHAATHKKYEKIRCSDKIRRE